MEDKRVSKEYMLSAHSNDDYDDDKSLLVFSYFYSPLSQSLFHFMHKSEEYQWFCNNIIFKVTEAIYRISNIERNERILDHTVSRLWHCIWLSSSSSRDLGSVEYPFIAITSRSALTGWGCDGAIKYLS